MSSLSLPNAARVFMVTRHSLAQQAELGRVLSVFEHAEALEPTHWGPDERAREAYDRKAMIAGVTGLVQKLGGDFLSPGLARRKPLRWQGYFLADTQDLSAVVVEIGAGIKTKDMSKLLALGDALAVVLEVQFGSVHFEFEDNGSLYNMVGRMVPRYLQERGPLGVAVRTWLGPHIVGLVKNSQELRPPGVLVRDTAWGGLQIDLDERPADVSRDVLLDAQKRVMAALAPTGIFRYDQGPELSRPALAWKPIP